MYGTSLATFTDAAHRGVVPSPPSHLRQDTARRVDRERNSTRNVAGPNGLVPLVALIYITALPGDPRDTLWAAGVAHGTGSGLINGIGPAQRRAHR